MLAGLVHHGHAARHLRGQSAQGGEAGGRQRRELLIEPINRRDIPGYFLNKTYEARSVIHEVGEPNLACNSTLSPPGRGGRRRHGDQRVRPLARHYQTPARPTAASPTRAS
jgi:hydroxypyruvate isomerase